MNHKNLQVLPFKIGYVCILAFFSGINIGAKAQAPEMLQQQFASYGQQTLQEKLFVHTDKNFYLAGEICWFKIYNTDAFFNKPLGLSKLAYVEILDKNNKPVLQAKIALKEGDGDGSLQLPVSLGSGKYLLRAYTSWMKNFNAAYFFEKPLTIINAGKIYEGSTVQQKDKYDIQFFPEGGNLVNSVQSRVAFRVVDQGGKGVSCSGIIVNDKSDTLVNYTALKFGMGSFMFTPEIEHTYKAIINLPGGNQVTQAMPSAYNSGYVMHLVKTNNQLKITVQVPATNNYAPAVYLFAHTRGITKLVQSGTIRNGYAEFFVDTDKLGEGISHFTVFNADRQPVCERLFFKKPAPFMQLTATTDQQEYDQRKKVNIHIAAAAQDGKPLLADMSMAVYRIDSLTTPEEMSIGNYLWLSSDLTGGVESPDYYFASKTAEAEEAMDNLMLTQGWSRFRWDDILQQKKPAFEFTPEYKGHIIKGRLVSNAGSQPEPNIECYLSVAGTKSEFRTTLSDDSGFVHFEMNNFYGGSEIILQSRGQRDSTMHVEVASPFADKYSATALPAFSLSPTNAASLLNQHISVQVLNTFTGNRLKQWSLAPNIDTTPFYSKPDGIYMLDDYVRFTTIEEILREYVPEVNVRRREGKYHLPVFDNIRKEYFQNDPLILLDGVPAFDVNKLMAYDPLKIRKLEVVSRMYFYGKLIFGGIVNFITYNGDLPGYELDPHTTVVDYEGMQLQREFFSPVYGTKEQYAARLPDYRNLLYWSPEVKTTREGKQETGFYTSDLPGKFAIVLQGITPDGKTGSTVTYFQVKEEAALADKR